MGCIEVALDMGRTSEWKRAGDENYWNEGMLNVRRNAKEATKWCISLLFLYRRVSTLQVHTYARTRPKKAHHVRASQRIVIKRACVYLNCLYSGIYNIQEFVECIINILKDNHSLWINFFFLFFLSTCLLFVCVLELFCFDLRYNYLWFYLNVSKWVWLFFSLHVDDGRNVYWNLRSSFFIVYFDRYILMLNSFVFMPPEMREPPTRKFAQFHHNGCWYLIKTTLSCTIVTLAKRRSIHHENSWVHLDFSLFFLVWRCFSLLLLLLLFS